jgi:hypothetical protein
MEIFIEFLNIQQYAIFSSYTYNMFEKSKLTIKYKLNTLLEFKHHLYITAISLIKYHAKIKTYITPQRISTRL